jgi:hypothetical protein
MMDREGARVLLRYGLLSYGIAAIEWLLDPKHLIAIFPSLRSIHPSLSDSVILIALSILPLVWLTVVVAGIRKTGWPGIILLLPIWWGLWWWNIWAMVFLSCISGRDCL